MKHKNRIDIYGKIDNVRILRSKSTKLAKLCVTTEDLHDDIMLPVIVWESKTNSSFDLLTMGTTVHIIGKVRAKNLTTEYRLEKTVRDIVASRVEIINTSLNRIGLWRSPGANFVSVFIYSTISK